MGRKVTVVEETTEDRVQRAKSYAYRAFMHFEEIQRHLNSIREYVELTANYAGDDDESCDCFSKHTTYSVDRIRIQSMVSRAYEELFAMHEITEAMRNCTV